MGVKSASWNGPISTKNPKNYASKKGFPPFAEKWEGGFFTQNQKIGEGGNRRFPLPIPPTMGVGKKALIYAYERCTALRWVNFERELSNLEFWEEAPGLLFPNRRSSKKQQLNFAIIFFVTT